MSNIFIEPINFRQPEKKKSSSGSPSKFVMFVVLLLFIVLGCSVIFLLITRRVELNIAPAPDSIQIQKGFPSFRLGKSFLMLPGIYQVRARKNGYHDLDFELSVSKEKEQKYTFIMRVLPGLLYLSSSPENGAEIYINSKRIGVTPLGPIEQKAGPVFIKSVKENYLPVSTNILVTGKHLEQSVEIQLIPAWAKMFLESNPTGVVVSLKGEKLGQTPFDAALFEGVHNLEFSLEGYESLTTQLQVRANQPGSIKVNLDKARGHLELHSSPPGANVQINGDFSGQTPLQVSLPSEQDHEINLFKAGFDVHSFTVRFKPAEEIVQEIILSPKTNRVKFISQPSGAEVFSKEKLLGITPLEMELPALPLSLVFKLKGYANVERKFVPRQGPLQVIKVTLLPKAVHADLDSSDSSSHLRATNGYELVYVKPTFFAMGSSRREAGRRSNETLLDVELTRPFYIGLTEVTNREFRKFNPSHHSGSFRGMTLNENAQPVVNISWEQAVAFCNWLSLKEKLEPAYEKKGNEWAFVNATGYRLPTEAEWEFCARFDSGKAVNKYPWGANMPPGKECGNLADVTAQHFLDVVITKYRDGHTLTAPVKKFKPNGLGLFDMTGNVAEWCHDYYSIYNSRSGTLLKDPKGPQKGRHHVIRGSSWRDASITNLRCSFRGYGEEPRNNLGFRICRYAK